MKYVVKIHDIGTDYLITGVDKKQDNETLSFEMYRRVSEEVYNKIKRMLSTHKFTFSKDIISDCISFFNIKTSAIDPLKLRKTEAFSKGRMAFSNRLDFSIIFDFFQMIVLNNFFQSKGYNIVTDQEETFFEIIQSDDDEIKNKLEEYLRIQDEISKHDHWFRKFKHFESSIQKAKTIEEVEDHLSTFLSMLQ